MQRMGGCFREQKWATSQASMIDCAHVYTRKINLVSLKKEFLKVQGTLPLIHYTITPQWIQLRCTVELSAPALLENVTFHTVDAVSHQRGGKQLTLCCKIQTEAGMTGAEPCQLASTPGEQGCSLSSWRGVHCLSQRNWGRRGLHEQQHIHYLN